MTSAAKFRKKSAADLQKEAQKLRTEIAEVTRERFTSDGKDYANIAKKKKDLARILTIITEKQSEEEPKAKESK